MYNILVVDDSALMRKFMCDIINSVDGYHVADVCADGETAYLFMKRHHYDAVTMNMYMPTIDGIHILEKLKDDGIHVPVIAIASSAKEDRELALEAVELGALELVVRPFKVNSPDMKSFSKQLLELLNVAIKGETYVSSPDISFGPDHSAPLKRNYDIVAIASSTGGPKALQSFIPFIKKDIGVPIVIVQHMPSGFTASLAERLDSKSKLSVIEAKSGDILKPNTVYIAKGGMQFYVEKTPDGEHAVKLTNDPPINNLRPCADLMYQSLEKSGYTKILCIVLTGMGSDGTEGIRGLKAKKKIHVITQDERSCVVYGMPKSANDHGLSDESCDINEMATVLVKELGV